MPSEIFPGHYKTYLETEQLDEESLLLKVLLD